MSSNCVALLETRLSGVCVHTHVDAQTAWPFPDCLLYFIQGFVSPSGLVHAPSLFPGGTNEQLRHRVYVKPGYLLTQLAQALPKI